MTRKTSWIAMAAIGGALVTGVQAQEELTPLEREIAEAQAQQAQQPAPATQPAPQALSIAPDPGRRETEVTTYNEIQTLPDTGGAPLLMSLGGVLLVCGGLLLRRKIS